MNKTCRKCKGPLEPPDPVPGSIGTEWWDCRKCRGLAPKGLAALLGKWPGTETDEQVAEAFKSLKDK